MIKMVKKKTEEQSTLRKILSDLRTPYFFLLGIYIISVLVPLPIPTGISENTQTFKSLLDATPSGGIILMETNQVFTYGSSAETMITLYRYLLAQDWKIVWFSAFPTPGTGVQGWLDVLAYLDSVGAGPAANGMVYGEDYVYLGWLPGGEGAISSVLEDLWATAPADWEATPLSDLPLMAGLNSYADFDLVLAGPIWGVHCPWWIRQYWAVGRADEVPLLIWVPHIGWYPAFTYAYAFPAGWHGPETSWEWAQLHGETSPADYLKVGLSLGSLTMFGYMVLINISILYKRFVREED